MMRPPVSTSGWPERAAAAAATTVLAEGRQPATNGASEPAGQRSRRTAALVWYQSAVPQRRLTRGSGATAEGHTLVGNPTTTVCEISAAWAVKNPEAAGVRIAPGAVSRIGEGSPVATDDAD